MIRAIVIKELRENAWIAATALALYLALVYQLIPREKSIFNSLPTFSSILRMAPESIPFVSGPFGSYFVMISCAAALGLGFRQSTRESGASTYLFLLHRPWSRDKIFLTKLAVGAALLLVCGAVPIVEYGWWASMPGDVAAPFEWSMTLGEWICWAIMPLAYLAAFLSGLRPAQLVRHTLAPSNCPIIGGYHSTDVRDVDGAVDTPPGHAAAVLGLSRAHHSRGANARLFVAQQKDGRPCDGSPWQHRFCW